MRNIANLVPPYTTDDATDSTRRHWQTRRSQIREELLGGCYQLSPVQGVGNRNGHRLTRWEATDAVVLKAIALTLTPIIQRRLKGGGQSGASGDASLSLCGEI